MPDSNKEFKKQKGGESCQRGQKPSLKELLIIKARKMLTKKILWYCIKTQI